MFGSHRTSVGVETEFCTMGFKLRFSQDDINVGDELGEYLRLDSTRHALESEMHSTSSSRSDFVAAGNLDFACPSGLVDVQTHLLDEGLADKAACGTGV